MIDKKELISSIFYPRKSHIKEDSQDQLIQVGEKVRVGIRYFLKDKSFANVLFFHGNAELAQEYDDVANYYNRYDINFIVADYRGYGLSDGIPDKDNLLSDAKKIYTSVRVILKEKKFLGKCLIMGRSLGSASACEIISSFEKDIDGCIIESGFATEYPLLRLMHIEPEKINFTLKDGFMNLQKIKKYTKPIFIIHADLDDIIPFSQAEIMLFESQSKEKDLYKIEGANHNNIILIGRDEYFKRIKLFIDGV